MLKPQLILLFTLLCFSTKAQTSLLGSSLENFSTAFSIEKDSDNNTHLIALIELNNDSYVISPFSKDTIYGHLDLSIKDTDAVSFEGALSESPISTSEYDPILETEVKFVRLNTRYKQGLNINTEEDFEVAGVLWFLLEPQCVPYKIDYLLIQNSDKLSVEKLNTNTDY